MKRTLSLLLALALALCCSVVGFAEAEPVRTLPTITWEAPERYEAGSSFTIAIGEVTPGSETTDEGTAPVTVTQVTYTLSDDLGTQYQEGTHYTLDAISRSKITVTPPAEAKQVVVIATALCDDTAGTTITKPFLLNATQPPREVQQAVIDAVEQAVDSHTETITLNAAELENETLYAVDWQYLANAWQQHDWGSLGRGLMVMNGTTFFTFDEKVIDSSFEKDLSFGITNGLEFETLTEEEAYALIRQLTGDTKNPYVFGFAQNGVVPRVTVSHVVPQNWINQYGQKNLTLFAWQEPIVAIRNDNGQTVVVEEAKVLSSTKVEIQSAVTQRMEFETGTLYGTLVLTGSGSLSGKDPTTIPEAKPQDPNPNTGAGDLVTVATVFAVISLLGGAALIWKKARA